MNSLFTPMIEVNQVVKRFPVADRIITVLDQVSFSVQKGEFVAIVGPSGNGKSTLLNMITGIDHPNQGQVIVSGKAIHNLKENELAAWRNTQIGIVFQFFQLLPSLNLLQNVILPMEFNQVIPKNERRQQAMALLDMVGLADQALKLPSMVSGGQQQRAAIARALANDPPLIVADEPTGNLDSRTADDVFCLFLNLAQQGKTLVMVTHNQSLADQLPRKLEIINGRIAKDHLSSEDLDQIQRIHGCSS